MARSTAASAPGTSWTFFGRRFHSTITAMVPAPTASEASAAVLPRASTTAPGRPAILSMPEAGAFRPAAAYSWPAMITRPMPASMPSTTDTEIARNQRPSFQRAHGELQQTGGEHDHPEGGQPELADRLEDQHGQTGRRAGDLQAAAGHQTGDEAAHDAGDQAEFGRYTGGDGDAHAQREGDQEHDERGAEVLTQVGEPGVEGGLGGHGGLGRHLGHLAAAHRVSNVSVSARCSRTAPVWTS